MHFATVNKLVAAMTFLLAGCSTLKPDDCEKFRALDDCVYTTTSEKSSTPDSIAKNALPPYPAKAAARKISGSVTVRYDIDSRGTLLNLQIVTSSPRGVFEREVLNTLKNWRFNENKPMKNIDNKIIFDINEGVRIAQK